MEKKLKIILKKSLKFLQYPVIFLAIYLAVNWYRMPELPTNLALTMTDYQGHVIDLKVMSDKQPVLLYFWGSWCGICKTSSPKVNQLSKEGYPVVTVAVQSGDNEELIAYLEEYKLDFTTVNDPTGDLFNSWQGQVAPSFVILSEGKVTQGMTGAQPLWSLRFRMFLQTMLKTI